MPKKAVAASGNNNAGNDVFNEAAFLVTPEHIKDFRQRLLAEIELDPGPYHPADAKRIQESDDYCKRFIRHKKCNVSYAIDLAKHVLKWRKEFGIHDITEASLPVEFFQAGAFFPYNTDRFGSHLLILRVKFHRKNSAQILDMKKFIVYFVEKVLLEMNAIRITLLLDCSDAGINHVDLELIKFLISLFKEYYPWSLGYIIVYDMPWLLNAVWKLIKSWLPMDGVERIKFADKNSIHDFIDRDKLPSYMGGHDTYEYSYKPGQCFGQRCDPPVATSPSVASNDTE